MIGIYKIENKITHQIYIGQSINIKDRWRQHRNLAGQGNNLFHNALKKYGVDNFDWVILEECCIEKLDEREKYWICYYNSLYPQGYNLTDGGQNQHTSYHRLKPDEIKEIQFLLQNEPSIDINNIALRYNVSFQTISDINTGKTHILENQSYPLRTRKDKINLTTAVFCKQCGKKISSKATLCLDCIRKNELANRPSKEDLAKMIASDGFEATGRKYGVSGKAIQKWCKRYGLPLHKQEIQEYIKKM